MAKTPRSSNTPSESDDEITDTVLPEAPSLPSEVRLLRPFGFYDEDGKHLHWCAGAVVDDAADIAILSARGAHLIILEE